jgi:hypothetical protein
MHQLGNEVPVIAPPDISDYHWLTSGEARPWLARASEELASTSLLTLLERLRRELPAARANLLLEQATLRPRAAVKFSRASEMFFTPIGLEQSTDEAIARYKAGRFALSDDVVDLCCGIGGDAIGLALGCRSIRLVDRQSHLALLAEANVRAYLPTAGLESPRVSAHAGDVREIDYQTHAWHADPDRRARGKRTTVVENYDPSPEVLDRWLARQPAGAIKLAPAARLLEGWAGQAECEWISHRGECRQLVAWFGPLAQHGGRRSATVLARDHTPRRIVGRGDVSPASAALLGRYVYEPDPAVFASSLVGELSAAFELQAIDGPLGYLTSDSPILDPLVAGFEVLDVLPFQLKRLKAYFRQRAIGRLEVKKRGVNCDPLALQKQLASSADGAATVLVASHGEKTIAMVARRLVALDANPDPKVSSPWSRPARDKASSRDTA